MWPFDQHEPYVRLTAFVAVFVVMAIVEAVAPRKSRTNTRATRWLTNFALVVIDIIAVRLLVPVLAVAAAEVANAKGWGVFSVIDAPFWIEVVAAVVLLDLLIYAQHVVSHKVPILWAVHKVHHADRDIDVTTGFRFHPIEIVLSMLFKLVCIAALGPPALGVFVFEILLSGSAMFNHANVKLPLGVDRILRWLLVTPDMHRVHHSIVHRETDSNYGFCLSVWDRLFRTYVPQPRAGHHDMTIGLSEYQNNAPCKLAWSLKLPFRAARLDAKPPAE